MRILTLATIALGAIITAVPAAAETTAASGDARVLNPINFSLLLELDFGSVVSTPVGGTILLDPGSGNRDCSTGGLVCTGVYSVARLILTGSDAMVTVTYAPTLQLTGPGDPMTVTPLFPGGSGSQVPLTGGTATFDFGAALTVNPGQAAGVYTGTFSVNVEYN